MNLQKILLLLFCAFSIHAFEPMQNQKVLVLWDYDPSINDSEIILMKQNVKTAFKKRILIAEENDSVPRSFKVYHTGYKRNDLKPLNFNSYDKIDKVMLVHYERKIVYDLPGSFQFFAFVPFGLVPVSMTDDDPDWCHQSMVSIDIYDIKTGKRNYTFVSNQESGSMNSYDQEEFDDNIESIADDIEEKFFDEYSWKQIQDSTQKTVRDTGSLIISVKKRLGFLFDNNRLGPDSVTVTVTIDEYGNVSDVRTERSGTATDTLFRMFFSPLNMGRMVIPNDKASFRITFKTTSYKEYRLVNGYYASIEGYRDKEEIWRILYWHIDQYVKNRRMLPGNRSESLMHISFDINRHGNVENLVFEDGTGKALKNIDRSYRIISGWEFGDKGDEKAFGNHIECVFTLNNDKISVRKD